MKDWIWSNCREKLLASMIIVEDGEEQHQRQQEFFGARMDDKCELANMEEQGEESSTLNDDDYSGESIEGGLELKNPEDNDDEIGQHAIADDVVDGHTSSSTASTAVTSTT